MFLPEVTSVIQLMSMSTRTINKTSESWFSGDIDIINLKIIVSMSWSPEIQDQGVVWFDFS